MDDRRGPGVVEQVEGEVILARLVTGELRAFGVAAEAGADQVIGQAAVPEGQRFPVGHGIGDELAQVGEVEGHGDLPGCWMVMVPGVGCRPEIDGSLLRCGRILAEAVVRDHPVDRRGLRTALPPA